MGSLDVLARLAKQAVDRERQALQRVNSAMEEMAKRIESLKATSLREAAGSADFMTVGATLPAYLQATKQRIGAAFAQYQKLQALHAEQLQKLQQQRLELKRYERLRERRARQQAQDLVVKEQKRIEELVMIKRGGRGNSDL